MPVGRALLRRGIRPMPVSGQSAIAVAAWTPAQINPAGWWDAQSPATLTTSSGAISAWSNKGTQGGSLAQATTAAQPTLSSTIGGLPAVNVNGSQYVEGTLTLNQTTLVVAGIMVMQSTTTDTGRAMAFVQAATQDFASTANDLISRDGSNQAVFSYRGGPQTAPNAITYNTPFLFLQTFDGTTMSMAVNEGTATTTASSGSFNATQARIGRGFTGGADSWTGAFGEVVVSNTLPTSADLRKLMGYLAWHWGQQALLPAGHPYKTGAP